MDLDASVSQEQVDALALYLAEIPAPTPFEGLDPQAVAAGRALFFDARIGCATCHAGDQFTDNQLYDVGTGGLFYTPTLLGIGLRQAFMHDGCASTLRARFGLCGGGDQHGIVSGLSSAEVDALVTFMNSL
jgi:cytochrome c peroxidase